MFFNRRFSHNFSNDTRGFPYVKHFQQLFNNFSTMSLQLNMVLFYPYVRAILAPLCFFLSASLTFSRRGGRSVKFGAPVRL